jgi:hypothetical protein
LPLPLSPTSSNGPQTTAKPFSLLNTACATPHPVGSPAHAGYGPGRRGPSA